MNVAAVLRSLYPSIVIGEQGQSDCTVEDDGNGPRIARWLRAEKQPTMQEIEAAWPAVQAALAAEAAERRTADDQQSAGIVEAKRAYARMKTIIDGADTATTAQLRAAIKEMAGTIQHLIRAAVR
jgi:TPP-dependent indolepyruvate ferredoxin oxidoreductase alpha subunit